MSGLSQRAENPSVLGITVFVAAILIMSGGWHFFLGNFLWLPTYPIWGVVLIAVDVAIVWALVNSSRSASGS